MKIIGVIPARMASTRFPGKPLARICGLTMIEHVYKRSARSTMLDELYVATCDEAIKETVEAFGGKVVMTRDNHKRCTDRIAEACESIKTDADIVINIQGDEPLVFPEMIDLSVRPLIDDESIQCANLIAKIDNDAEWEDPNEIKVVQDLAGYALYFSREPVPSKKKGSRYFNRWKQVCIIPFRREFLLKFIKMSQTPLEIAESIDMLRALEHGIKIKLVESSFKTYSVDTEEDRVRVEKIMENDGLFKKYGRV